MENLLKDQIELKSISKSEISSMQKDAKDAKERIIIPKKEMNSKEKRDAKKNAKNDSLQSLSKNLQNDIESLLIDSPKSSNGGMKSQSLYSIPNWENLNDRIRKGIRSKLRSNLESYKNDILGKDRSAIERINAIKSFLKGFNEGFKISFQGIEYLCKYQSKSLNDASLYEGNDSIKRDQIKKMISMIEFHQIKGLLK